MAPSSPEVSPPSPPPQPAISHPSAQAQRLFYPLLLCAVALLSFANSFGTGFPLDNRFIILDDERVHSATPEHLRQIFTETYWWPKVESGLYRPVTTLSYLLNYAVLGGGRRPAGYHWFNFGLHLIGVVLLYRLALRLMEARAPAFFAAALWAAHPINTESVTNIVGRADEFAAIVVLGGLLLYIRATRAAGWRKLPWMAALVLATSLGEFAKESAVAVLGAMLLYDLAFRFQAGPPRTVIRQLGRWLVQGYLWMAAPLVLLWKVRARILAGRSPAEFPFVDNPLIRADFWTGRLTAIKVLGKQICLWLWPARLSCDYSYNQIPLLSWRFDNWADWAVVFSLVLLLSMLAAAIYLFRRNRAAFFFGMFFFVTIAPTSNVFVVVGSIMAERFLYLPGMALAACLALGVFEAARRLGGRGAGRWTRYAAPVMLAVCVAAASARTLARNVDWQDEEHLWRAAERVVPNSFKVYKSLAFVYFEKDPKGAYINQSIAYGEKAVQILNNLPDDYSSTPAFTHLGIYYRIRGDQFGTPAAGGVIPGPVSPEWYQKSLQILDRGRAVDEAFNRRTRDQLLAAGQSSNAIHVYGFAPLYGALAQTWLRLRQPGEALAALRRWRAIDPFQPDVYFNIRNVNLALGDLRAAGVALLELRMIQESPAAAQGCIQIYRRILPGGCAVVPKQGQEYLNLDCPMVRNDVCVALLDLTDTFAATRYPSFASRMRESATRKFGCPAAPFERALGGGAVF